MRPLTSEPSVPPHVARAAVVAALKDLLEPHMAGWPRAARVALAATTAALVGWSIARQALGPFLLRDHYQRFAAQAELRFLGEGRTDRCR